MHKFVNKYVTKCSLNSYDLFLLQTELNSGDFLVQIFSVPNMFASLARNFATSSNCFICIILCTPSATTNAWFCLDYTTIVVEKLSFFFSKSRNFGFQFSFQQNVGSDCVQIAEGCILVNLFKWIIFIRKKNFLLAKKPHFHPRSFI